MRYGGEEPGHSEHRDLQLLHHWCWPQVRLVVDANPMSNDRAAIFGRQLFEIKACDPGETWGRDFPGVGPQFL